MLYISAGFLFTSYFVINPFTAVLSIFYLLLLAFWPRKRATSFFSHQIFILSRQVEDVKGLQSSIQNPTI